MAEAILSKALSGEIVAKENVSVFDISKNRLNYLSAKYSISIYDTAVEAVENADIILFAVKPQHFAEAASMCEGSLNGKAVVSIMAGITLEQLKNTFHKSCRIARVMPNTPALVAEGMSMLCTENDLKDSETEFLKSLLETMGKYELLSEKYIDAFIGIAGSSPAYVYMFIEAMADAGVLNGLPREAAYRLASQSVLGAAKMVMETGMHPGTLKDMVCSPGGTTIEAVESLENDGFRGTVINAVNACTEKSKYLSRKKDEEN